MGGVNISDRNDVNLAWENPALLDSSHINHVSVSYLDYLSDIQMSQLSYATDVKSTGGLWFAGLKYFNLGEIESRDEVGNLLGTFRSNEFALTIGHGRQAGNFHLGVNMKFVGSTIASFNSTALLFDLGGTFVHPITDFTAALTISNIGFTLGKYTEEGEVIIPWDVRTGLTYKPTYMPFRLSLTAHSLVNGDVLYYNQGDGFSDSEPGTADKIFAHVVMATEIIIHRSFSAFIGYNHQRRKELRLPSTSGGAGLSFGTRLAIKSLNIAYSRVQYHVAGGSNTFTLSVDLNRLIRKK